MFRNAFRAVAVVLVTGALAPSVPASAGMDPASFINNLGDQLQAVTRSASTQQRLAGFEELFHASFDIPGLGRFVLGRFWRAFTPFEQQEFLSLFERYVVLTYSEKLSDYTGEGGCPRVPHWPASCPRCAPMSPSCAQRRASAELIVSISTSSSSPVGSRFRTETDASPSFTEFYPA